MTKIEAIAKLAELKMELKSGYAYDVCHGLLHNCDEMDVYASDTLFRSLVLDHSYSVESAKEAFYAAEVVLERD